ncbi:hypothetical protein NL108_015017 [Boleophthalmus pectinirostris]|nr:hypothetical protein NL108_015017 [Boleophthalmus pectinirostris]
MHDTQPPTILPQQVTVNPKCCCQTLTSSKKRDHITPILAQLHWSPVKYRIDFKIVLFVFKSLNSLAPQHITDLLTPHSLLVSQVKLAQPSVRPTVPPQNHTEKMVREELLKLQKKNKKLTTIT